MCNKYFYTENSHSPVVLEFLRLQFCYETVEILKKENHYILRDVEAGLTNNIERLKHLTKDLNRKVRSTAYRNSNITQEMFEEADYRDSEVRHDTVQNVNVPIAILKELSEDETLQGFIAKHPKTPIEILKKNE